MPVAGPPEGPPTSESIDDQDASTQGDPLAVRPGEEYSVPLDREAWWPKQLKEAPLLNPVIPEVSQSAHLLDEVSQAHLRAFLYHALPDKYAAYRSSVFTAVVDALAVTGEVETLSSLRKTASMMVRARAHVRSGADAQQQGALVQHPTWSRLGWATSMAGGREPERTDRVRKRDVALAMLTNAIWLVVSNGTTEADTPHKQDTVSPDTVSTTQSSLSVRREGLPRGTGMPTMFLAPSTPTTAVSMALSQTPAAEYEFTDPFSSQFLEVGSEDAAGTSKSLDPDASSFSTTPSTASASQISSRALEKLSSLNVGPRATDREDGTARSRETSRSSSVSSRISKGHQVAEIERSSAEPVDAACQERAKIVIATVFVDTVAPHAGAVPTASMLPALAGSHPSRLSVRFDETVAGHLTCEDLTPTPSAIGSQGQKVYWQPDVFRGENLFANGHQRVDMDESAASERVTQKGGTFVITSDSIERAQLVKDTIAVAYYIAASMLLETALLHDLGHQRAVVPEPSEPPRAVALDDLPAASMPPVTEPLAPSVKPQERHKRTGSRWSKGLWGAVQSSSAALSAALSSKATSPEQSFDEHLEFLAGAGLKLARSRTFDKTKRTSDIAGRSRTNSRNSIPASLTSRLPTKLGRLFREQESPRSSIDGLPEEEEVSSIISLDRTSATSEPQAHHQKEGSSASKEYIAGRGSSYVNVETAPVMPLSASPELSQRRQESAHSAPPLSGEDFERHFAEAQSIVMLIGTQAHAAQATPPSASRSSFVRSPTPQPVSYFSSLSSATSAVRKLSGVVQSSTAEPLLSPTGLTGEDVDTPHPCSPARWKHLKREAVAFYAKEAPGKDISLGQVLEEMCLRAEKTQSGSDQVGSERDACVYYIHGRHRVSISTRSYEQGSTSDARTANGDTPTPSSFVKVAASEASNTAEDSPETPMSLSICALGGSSLSDSKAIYLWSANVQTREESSPVQMSQATWLFSFARYLETIIYHPQAGCENGPYDTVRLFQRGATVAKVCVAPLTVYQLESEGPVVCKTSDSRLARDNIDAEVLNTLRTEIQTFFASLEEAIAAAEASCHTATFPNQQEDLRETDTNPSAEEDADSDALEMLRTLRERVKKDEAGLMTSADTVAFENINDLRRRFTIVSRGARERFEVWRQKYRPQDKSLAFERDSCREPLWMASDRYVFPGSGYVVCEDEPLSVIAFSLSSREFKLELNAPQQFPTDGNAHGLDWQEGFDSPSGGSSRFSTISIASMASSASHRQETDDPAETLSASDPFRSGGEAVRVATKRKKRAKEGSILALTLRRVGSNVSADASQLHGTRADIAAQRSEERSYDVLSASGLDPAALFSTETWHAPRGRRKFVSDTISSSQTNSTFRAQVTPVSNRVSTLGSMFAKGTTQDDALRVSAGTSVDTTASPALWTPRLRPQYSASSLRCESGQISVSANAPKESPHIKHNVYQGSTKVSCTSWFAEDFAALRAKWGIEEDFIASLSKSSPWVATGGKSRSTFFKTMDEKWIGKQLLTVWNVDEKDALLEFTPAYIRYMMNSHMNDCPSLLVKIAGFYSLKIKDVKSGEIRMKMSLMILENIFADGDEKTVKFDLKGIKERRAARATPTDGVSSVPPVLWDAEWIEGYQAKAFVPEEERDLFTKALRNDLAFLTGSLLESNVMDFSLLVGVNESPTLPPPCKEEDGQASVTSPTGPSIRVRIVDYISAFTLAKQLESSSKKALKSTEAKGSVTALPPSEYAARFEAAMLSYFIGVPERDWENGGRPGSRSVEARSGGLPSVL